MPFLFDSYTRPIGLLPTSTLLYAFNWQTYILAMQRVSLSKNSSCISSKPLRFGGRVCFLDRGKVSLDVQYVRRDHTQWVFVALSSGPRCRGERYDGGSCWICVSYCDIHFPMEFRQNNALIAFESPVGYCVSLTAEYSCKRQKVVVVTYPVSKLAWLFVGKIPAMVGLQLVTRRQKLVYICF